MTQSHVLYGQQVFRHPGITTTRRMRFPQEKELIVADTVGFIRNLPKELMEVFSARLPEELEAADLLVHVADASQTGLPQQIESVEKRFMNSDWNAFRGSSC